MKEIETSKFYYGFPIFLVGYKDEKYGYNFSTMSSSYSIDDVVMCGLGKEGGAYSQIQKYKYFSINLVSSQNKHLIGLGATSKIDKFSNGKDNNIPFKVDEEYDVPLIGCCSVQMICQMQETFIMDSLPSVANIGAVVKKRLFADEYVKNGDINVSLIETVNYYATQNKKDFRIK